MLIRESQLVYSNYTSSSLLVIIEQCSEYINNYKPNQPSYANAFYINSEFVIKRLYFNDIGFTFSLLMNECQRQAICLAICAMNKK